MIKYTIIATILIVSYSILLGLMKASGKKTPPIPDIPKDSSNKDYNN